MFGLFAFFYASLHFLTYLWFDKLFDFGEILKDVGKRPFITAGFATFLCMLPLAVSPLAGVLCALAGVVCAPNAAAVVIGVVCVGLGVLWGLAIHQRSY